MRRALGALHDQREPPTARFENKTLFFGDTVQKAVAVPLREPELVKLPRVKLPERPGRILRASACGEFFKTRSTVFNGRMSNVDQAAGHFFRPRSFLSSGRWRYCLASLQ